MALSERKRLGAVRRRPPPLRQSADDSDDASSASSASPKISVPPDGRPAFDAGSVPSLASAAGAARKSVAKIWQTAGFRERRLPDGTLQYTNDLALSDRQRAQQSAKRRRAA